MVPSILVGGVVADVVAIGTTAEDPGDLLAWPRTAGGMWLGLVMYLPFADEWRERVCLERQLLPAYAVRPRKYGRS